METSAFTEWYDGLVGFSINNEYILDDLTIFGEVDPGRLRRWMAVCWNNALEAAEQYNSINLEKLKEPLDTDSKI